VVTALLALLANDWMLFYHCATGAWRDVTAR
jgi:hypothetical protein